MRCMGCQKRIWHHWAFLVSRWKREIGNGNHWTVLRSYPEVQGCINEEAPHRQGLCNGFSKMGPQFTLPKDQYSGYNRNSAIKLSLEGQMLNRRPPFPYVSSTHLTSIFRVTWRIESTSGDLGLSTTSKNVIATNIKAIVVQEYSRVIDNFTRFIFCVLLYSTYYKGSYV